MSKIIFQKKEQKNGRCIVTEGKVVGTFLMVEENQEFIFQGLCPYCKGDLTYRCEGWEQDNSGLWRADHLDFDCSTMPDMENEEWEDWFQQHSDKPYIHQLPVNEAVKKFINNRYRFNVK